MSAATLTSIVLGENTRLETRPHMRSMGRGDRRPSKWSTSSCIKVEIHRGLSTTSDSKTPKVMKGTGNSGKRQNARGPKDCQLVILAVEIRRRFSIILILARGFEECLTPAHLFPQEVIPDAFYQVVLAKISLRQRRITSRLSTTSCRGHDSSRRSPNHIAG